MSRKRYLTNTEPKAGLAGDELRIVLPIRIPSPGEYKRMHWAVNRAWREAMATLTLVALGPLRAKLKPPSGKRQVVIVSHRRALIRDEIDNLPNLAKLPLDVLRRHPIDLIIDDGREWCEGRVEQVQDTHERTEIRISPIEIRGERPTQVRTKRE